MNEPLDHARLAYERAGRGCIVSLFKGKAHYVTMADVVRRLGSEHYSMMFLTAISDAVERYDPKREAVVVVENEKGFEVSIVSANGAESVDGLFFNPDEE